MKAQLRYFAITVSSSLELNGSEDYVRLVGTPQMGADVTLANAQANEGARVVLANLGSETATVNSVDNVQTIDGDPGTMMLGPGDSVTFQAVKTGEGAWGWESI